MGDDSKQMFSSQLSSEFACVPVGLHNTGTAWQRWKCRRKYRLLVSASSSVRGPGVSSRQVLVWGAVAGRNASEQRQTETKAMREFLRRRLAQLFSYPVAGERGCRPPCPALLQVTYPLGGQ